MTSDVRSVLGSLKELNNSNTISINVPSLDKKVSFKHASVSQHKDLLRSAFDGVDGVINRVNILNDIITVNCNKDVNFLITDKNAILLELRKASVGSKVKIENVEYDLNDLPTFNQSDIKLKSTVTEDGIKVKLNVPTLSTDTGINKKLGAELAKITDQQEKLKQSIDIVVTYETSKYIDSVQIGEDVISFSEVSSYERKELVNNLPIKLSNKILKYIGDIKAVTDRAITFEGEVMLEFDAGFLSAD